MHSRIAWAASHKPLQFSSLKTAPVLAALYIAP
eukprot:COSAG06_NODE_18695_length_873_cov_0.782946_3_plen_33_part_01